MEKELLRADNLPPVNDDTWKYTPFIENYKIWIF